MIAAVASPIVIHHPGFDLAGSAKMGHRRLGGADDVRTEDPR
jgi:hypothetical protein